MTDAEIKYESFLEYINSVLSTGEVAGLIAKDEKEVICAEIRPVFTKENKDYSGDPTNQELY